MLVTVEAVEKLRPDIWTFWVKPERPLRFIAGQYVELLIPHASADSRGEHRWLTISSTPQHNLIGLTTKFPEQPSTYKQTLRTIIPGTQLHVSDPIGDFVLPKLQSIPVVLVAAGIGITPMRSMVADMVERTETRPVQLLHLGRTFDDLLFTDTFLQSSIMYHQVLLDPPADWTGLRDRIDGKRVLAISGIKHSTVAQAETLFYLSGPEKLVMKIHDELIACGIDRQQIVLDYFPGYRDL